mgnify:CR=1 FL=1
MINHRNNEQRVIHMTSIASYIRNEFVKRFPSCAIDVTFHDDETISVVVTTRNNVSDTSSTYRCETSSDDDVFVFLNDANNDAHVVFPVPDDIE